MEPVSPVPHGKHAAFQAVPGRQLPVVRMLISEKDGYAIELESDSTPRIPVSKTYEQAVLARFNSRY